MTFKFVAKNLQTGMTGAVTVRAERESVAREKLLRSGFEVIRLARVTNDLANTIVLVNPVAAPRPRRSPEMSRGLKMKIRVGAFLHNLLSPFAVFS